MARMVVVYLLMTLFWKMRIGRVPACSEPRVGLRSASQTSPRLAVIWHLLSLNPQHNLSYLLQPAYDLLRQTQHTQPPIVFRQRRAVCFESDISEMPDTRLPLQAPPRSKF